MMWEEILREHSDYVDYIVRGEGEITLPELLDCHFSRGDASKVKGIAFRVDGRALATPAREYISDLDLIEGAWDLVDWGIYTYRPTPGSVLAIVNSSRGCNQYCSFCSQQLFWSRTWRAKSPEKFVSELEYIHTKYGVNAAIDTHGYNTLNDGSNWAVISPATTKAPPYGFFRATNAITSWRPKAWPLESAGETSGYCGAAAGSIMCAWGNTSATYIPGGTY